MDNRSIKIILAAALGMRIAMALYLEPKIYQPDEGVYVALANNVYEYGVFGSGTRPGGDRPPALPILLSGLFYLVGPHLLAARMLQALISVASIWALYRYGGLVFGTQTGLLAAAVSAIYPYFIYWSGILMTETLTIFFVTSALWQTHELFQNSGNRRTAVLAGFLWGCAALTRTQNLIFPALLGLALMLKNVKSTAAIKRVGLFLVCALALPSTWAARNHAHFNTYSLDLHAGYTLIIRTMFYDEDNIDTLVANRALKESDIYRQASRLPEAEQDLLYRRAALRFMREHPGRYLYNCSRNFWQFWRFYPRTDKSVGVVDSAFLGRPRGYFVALSLLTEPLLIGLGGLGLYAAWRRGLKIGLPCLFIGLTTVVHTFVIAQMRYRIPVMPWVILFAAYAVISWRQRGLSYE